MSTSDIQWAIEHSVETTAPLAFAWRYMTDVKNWDDPPAQFTLHGSFVSGSSGTTELPGQEPRQWRLREVKPQDSYTVEIALEGATILCRWVFAEGPVGQTRLTQLITLQGENASSYRDEVQQVFGPGLEPGMKKIATAIGQAYARDHLH
jgi:hypothetical protein